MEHEMKLHPGPFLGIRSEKQIYEVRINDEKRRLLKIGDIIEFSERPELKNKFKAKITDLLIFKSFKKLFSSI